MALFKRSGNHTKSVEDLLSPNNNNNNSIEDKQKSKWTPPPSKETVSSRQRREMNAGKGVRMRSRTAGSQDDLSGGASSWAKDKLMDQKRTIKQRDEELVEVKKNMKRLEEKVEIAHTKIGELNQAGSEKDVRIQAMKNERQTLLRDIEDRGGDVTNLQQKIIVLETSLEDKHNSLHMCQKSAEEKDVELLGMRHSFESDRNENANALKQYSAMLADQAEMNKTLQREIELLKQELDKQLEASSTVKQNLETELKSANGKCVTLTAERVQFEEACHRYETEISERIRENLHIMQDVDKAKEIEHKQLNFINELTKSNQELTNSVRALQLELEEVTKHLTTAASEKVDMEDDFNKTQSLLQHQQDRNKDIESRLTDNSQRLGEQGKTIEQLANEIEHLQKSLDDTKHELGEVTSSRDEYIVKCGNVESVLSDKELKYQSDNETFVKRDAEQNAILNQLVNDLEKMKNNLDKKTQLASQLETDLTELKNQTKLNRDSEAATIGTLERQLAELTNLVETQNANINKLQAENRDVTKKLVDGIETNETLKVENTNCKGSIKDLTEQEEALQGNLDDLTKVCNKMENECQCYRDKIAEYEETTEKQGSIFADLTDENEFFKAQLKEAESEAGQLKMNLGACVEKHKDEVLKLQEQNARVINNLNDELTQQRCKAQEEINELLNNFNEVENELTFCQDELTSKAKELSTTRYRLNDANNAAVDKEQKLLKDLETLNEQNENILHSEIRKFKVECDEKVLNLQQDYNGEVGKIRDETQANLKSIQHHHESEMADRLASLETKLRDELLRVSAERDDIQEKYTQQSADYDRIRTDTDTKLKSKQVELTSKSRIIDQLGRRIETQQKLVEYMMKALESERSKQNNSNGDVMRMLSGLQTSLDDKLTSLHSPLPPSPLPTYSSSSPKREILGSTSEPVISPIPSPTASPVADHHRDDFMYYLTGPQRDRRHNQTYPWVEEDGIKSKDVAGYGSGGGGDYGLSKSLPLGSAVDHQVSSVPTTSIHLSKSTKTVYFGEQIQTIMKTFEKLECLGEDSSPNKELNLEVWKQKIHFRLKVLENQMNDIDNVSNVSSSSASANGGGVFETNSTYPVDPSTPPKSVVYHPTTGEIRDLIDNVNKRYKKLGEKYLAEHSKLM